MVWAIRQNSTISLKIMNVQFFLEVLHGSMLAGMESSWQHSMSLYYRIVEPKRNETILFVVLSVS